MIWPFFDINGWNENKLTKSPYQTTFSHTKRNPNIQQPKSIKKNKKKQEKLSRKINRHN